MTQLEQAVLDKFRDFRIAFEALCEARYADKDLATTTNHGLMSAADKAKLDSLEKLIAGSGVTISGGTISAAGTYTLPTASTTVKGGVKVGNGLSMNGDSLNVTLQAGSNYVAGTNVTINGNTISAGGSTYSAATTTTSGLMSAADKAKLNNLASITTAGDNITITGGTISSANTTYSAVTTTTSGLMTAADKIKLNGIATSANNYALPTAAVGTKGGVRVGSGLSMSGETLSVAENLRDVINIIDDFYDSEKYARSPFDSENIVGLDLSHLVDGTNFEYETETGGTVKIRNGSSSYNVNSGISRGYVEVTTTQYCVVKVTYSIGSEANYDYGGCIVTENSPNTTFTRDNLKVANFFTGAGVIAKRTDAYVLDANKTYYLNFGYMKDGSGNTNGDRFYIYEISIATPAHANKDMFDLLVSGNPKITGNASITGVPTLTGAVRFSGNPTFSGTPAFTGSPNFSGHPSLGASSSLRGNFRIPGNVSLTGNPTLSGSVVFTGSMILPTVESTVNGAIWIAT